MWLVKIRAPARGLIMLGARVHHVVPCTGIDHIMCICDQKPTNCNPAKVTALKIELKILTRSLFRRMSGRRGRGSGKRSRTQKLRPGDSD